VWLFTPFGFFSAVAHRNAPDKLLVRARVYEDLVALKQQCKCSGIVTMKKSDYPYRVVVSRTEYARFVAQFVTEGVNYTNFKSGVLKSQGYGRESLYMDIWSTMRGAEMKIQMRERRGAFGCLSEPLTDFVEDDWIPYEHEVVEDDGYRPPPRKTKANRRGKKRAGGS
jgi:hypothetical protein